MVARERLFGFIRTVLVNGWPYLVPLVGLPWLATWMESDMAHLDLWRIWGTRLAVAAPVLLVALTLWRFHRLRLAHHRTQAALEDGVLLALLPRADGKPVRADQVRFWGRVVDILPIHQHISFEVQADSSRVHLVAAMPESVGRAFLTQLASEWAGARTRPLSAEEDRLQAAERESHSVTLKPLHGDLPIAATAPDPMQAVLMELSRLPEGVTAGMQLVVRGDPFSRRRLGNKASKRLGQENKFTTLNSKRHTKLLDARAQHAFLEVELRLWATAGSRQMARSVAESLARTVQAQYEPSNPLIKVGSGQPSRAFGFFSGSAWTAAELGQLAHLVGSDAVATLPTLATGSANPLPPSAAVRLPVRGIWATPRLKAVTGG